MRKIEVQKIKNILKIYLIGIKFKKNYKIPSKKYLSITNRPLK